MKMVRRSARLENKHFHPYILCIIDMQPTEFYNANIVIKKVMQLIHAAILDQAFIVIAQFKGAGETHPSIRQALSNYPYKAYLWHTKCDKSRPIKAALVSRRILVRQLKVCGVNTEYCVKDTVHGLSRKFYAPIKVIENACNGSDRTVAEAIHKMRTFYRNVEVI